MNNILETVPFSLREPINGNADAVIAAVVPQYAGDANFDEVLNFIGGAIRNQHRLGINKDGHPLEEGKYNTFKAKIVRVEDLERRDKESNFLSGRKARIILSAKGQNGDIEEQSIDTEWVEFFGARPEEYAFSIALANTIKEIAENNIGKEVIVRKGFITGVTTSKGGNSVRYCANIQPLVTSGDASNSGSSSSKAATSSPPKGDVDGLLGAIKDDKDTAKLFNKLSDEDQKLLPKLIANGLAANSPFGYIKKALESNEIKVNEKELGEIIDDYKGGNEEADLDLFFLIAEAVI